MVKFKCTQKIDMVKWKCTLMCLMISQNRPFSSSTFLMYSRGGASRTPSTWVMFRSQEFTSGLHCPFPLPPLAPTRAEIYDMFRHEITPILIIVLMGGVPFSTIDLSTIN